MGAMRVCLKMRPTFCNHCYKFTDESNSYHEGPQAGANFEELRALLTEAAYGQAMRDQITIRAASAS